MKKERKMGFNCAIFSFDVNIYIKEKTCSVLFTTLVSYKKKSSHCSLMD